jgi:hypothetical protein
MYYEQPQALNDEGTYFTTHNAGTGLAITTIIGYDATKPFLIIQNKAPVGGKKIMLDCLDLTTVVAGSAASALASLQLAVVLDDILRISTGGTDLTPNIMQPNMQRSDASIATVACGQLVPAAAHNARLISPASSIRPTVSATVADVVGELKHIVFGGGLVGPNGSIVLAQANMLTIPMPPIQIGPQQSCLLYLLYGTGATPVAATYSPELAWSERQ